MVSTVKTRPNHYEVLKLTPDASDEEIARAFARELSAPRAFGGLAEVGMAYETLRDPAKRRAYDAALGLRPEPRPVHSPAALWEVSPYFTRAAAHPAEQPAAETLPRPEPQVKPQPQADTVAVRKPAPFIAAPDVPSRPEPERQRSRAEAAPSLEQLIEQLHAVRQATERGSQEAERRPIGWSRTGAIAGGVVLATVLLGAWAGLEARDGEEPAEQAATVKLPAPKPLPASTIPSAAAKSERVAPVSTAPRRIARAVPPRRPARSQDRLADISRSLELAENASTPAVEAAPVQPVAASLPLPNSVVARTIERIGYACGEVASATAVDGASGVYKVTCTSGQSYRAVPVRGRYHFRRLGSR